MADLTALRIRADRVLQNRLPSLEVDMLAQAVYVLCDEVERLQEALDQIAQMTPVFDAKGTCSKRVNKIAAAALNPPQKASGEASDG